MQLLQKYITSKIDGKIYNRSNGHFTRHLRIYGLTYQEYYETYITGRREFCPFCNSARHLSQADHTYTQTCGSKVCQAALLSKLKLAWSVEKNDEVNIRRRKTNLDRYGEEHVCRLQNVKDKTKKTNEEITSNGKTRKEIQQEKTRNTKAERYGDPFYNNAEGIKLGWSRVTSNYMDEIIDKRRTTCLDRYGVENILMLPGIVNKVQSKNASLKEMTLPSGKIVSYRGYENLAIELLLEDYTENDLVIQLDQSLKQMPVIIYTNIHGIKCKYYPDIWVMPNRIIEVKSCWWYDAKGRLGYENRLSNNRLKAKATIDAGYDFEFWIYDDRKRLTIINGKDC